MLSYAEDPTSKSADRVRRATAVAVNQNIDRKINASIMKYQVSDRPTIMRRIQQLDEEWDIERILQINASTLALTGLTLGLTVDKKWLVVPAVVLSFLFQHGVQGWCPPLPILRRLGIRTRGEIDREKYALKALLGDDGSLN